jgi:hypothetical protein
MASWFTLGRKEHTVWLGWSAEWVNASSKEREERTKAQRHHGLAFLPCLVVRLFRLRVLVEAMNRLSAGALCVCCHRMHPDCEAVGGAGAGTVRRPSPP